jgi:hypothetical protein
MIYFCCDDERRRTAVQAHPTLNGIDFLDVVDDPLDPLIERQRTLRVHFLKDLSPGVLTEANVRIDGGERIQNIKATEVSIDGTLSNVLVVELTERGDFSTYILRLVQDATSNETPNDFDPILSTVDFSFKVACPSDFDCKSDRVCPPEAGVEPEINYLAKDYASFRQLMLDRMALVTPQWRERNTADLGIALVEMLAYVGDYLSYQQDAVATEAYLGTARRRTSIRRHARLVDYPMHDGRNSRAWVHFTVGSSGDGMTVKKGKPEGTTKLLTKIAGETATLIPESSSAFKDALNTNPLVFELLHDALLYQAHNEMKFYTWEARDCCLPKGATRATLRDDVEDRLRLRVGDVLIFEERKGPQTGEEGDANPAHRHAVKLTYVHPEAEEAVVNETRVRTEGTVTVDPLTDVPIVQIEWARADALPFPLCVSGETPTGLDDEISAALGNIALADHGMTFTDEPAAQPFDLERVPTSLVPDTVPDPNPALTAVSRSTANRCSDAVPYIAPARYRPRLTQSPVTHAAPYDSAAPSAVAAVKLTTEDRLQFPLPCVWLSKFSEDFEPETWSPVRDLLASHATSEEFVVEVENDGSVYLRFGDDTLGARPVAGTRFLARYRIGNGTSGNIGADTLGHLVSSTLSDALAIVAVRNPLPAEGGIEPETMEEVRQNAPSAFRVQQRAVTPADYEEITVRKELSDRCDIDAQRAAGTLRWTGSWHTMFVSVDRLGGAPVKPEFATRLRGCLERFRMAGQDLEVNGPQYVSLEIELVVCIKPGYFFSDVKRALVSKFSNRVLPDNSRGLFHPDNFTFGQPVYLSSVIAAAQSVAGVDSVVAKKFQRQRMNSNDALVAGKLELGRLEIARLNNDPNFPERGSFTITRG